MNLVWDFWNQPTDTRALNTPPRAWKCQASRRQIPGLNPPWSTFCHPVCTRNGRGLRPSGRIYRGRVDNAEYPKIKNYLPDRRFLFSFAFTKKDEPVPVPQDPLVELEGNQR